MAIEQNNLFATPESMADLQSWLSNLSGSEAVVASTAAGMAWNLASVCEAKGNKELVAAVREARATLNAVIERLEINNCDNSEEPFIEDCTTAIAMIQTAMAGCKS